MSEEMKWLDYEQKWAYLSDEDSKLYESVRNSTDEKDLTIKRLLEKIAGASRAAHRASTY